MKRLGLTVTVALVACVCWWVCARNQRRDAAVWAAATDGD